MDSALLVFSGLALVTVVGLVYLGIRKRQERLQKQILGLSWLQCIRGMLAHIQQHRGLTSAYLNGRRELLGDIETLQRQVSRDIVDVARMDDWIEAQDAWHGITQHWARLAGGYRDNSTDNNIAQHSALILSLLYLIDDMAQAHDLLLLKGPGNKPFNLSWRELLTAAEFIGQSRAVGMAVAALGHCDSISRIRLNYLCQKIGENTQKVWGQIPPPADQRELVEGLLQCINEELIRERVSIEPAAFFNKASKAIDSLHDHYDKLVEEQRWLLKS